jgi:transcriptional regulator with XRE-family HTH domain
MKKHPELAQRIRQLRGNTAQKDFAERLEISLQGYLNYEYGKRIPPGPVLSKLAEIGGVTVDWILTGDEQLTADRIGERPVYYLDNVSEKILKMLEGMSEEEKRAVLKYTQAQKHLVAEVKKQKEG